MYGKKLTPPPKRKLTSPSYPRMGGRRIRVEKPLPKRNPKRTLDDDGFQIFQKHLVSKRGNVPPSLPSPSLQISPPPSTSIGNEAIDVDSEEEDVGASTHHIIE
ncbi:hypothetical protein NPIL_49261 [Nephila pilipes]|uniref:Uncharacterized protein n=1 Tax=Nephila pilipes TaxID=299642 RepID=A0A8X6J520_NEPPI|nr:hypothetical protein NPIL_49261 [Nephila pilipes]